MSLVDQANFLLEKYNGSFTARQALEEGIASSVLSRMVKQELLERVGPGIYNDPQRFEDEFLIAQLRLNKGIYSLNTALYFYDMTDYTPRHLDMNFPRGYHSQYIKSLNVRPSWQVESLYNLGINTVRTPCGNLVRTYDIERTLCDIIQPHHMVQDEIIRDALHVYVRRRGKDLNQLLWYAKKLRVYAKMRDYMTILL